MPADVHPSVRLLTDFLVGKADDAAQAELETHLAACPECLARAAGLQPNDTFVELLASASTRIDDLRPSPSTPSPSAIATPTFIQSDAVIPTFARTAIPPVLVDHPKYRPVRLLGHGGMGSVWLAQHAVMDRPVAVKVIRPEYRDLPEAAARFVSEIRAAAGLKSPYIVTAHDAEAVGGTCILVMEYVLGQTLAEAVDGGPLPAAEACRAARDAACGLADAHAAGFVHRDVKPSNLIRTPEGVTKVLDFGLVSTRAQGPVSAATTGSVIGTPDYIAPEQAATPHAADTRSDIYALGCTLYHLLAGHVPYPLDSGAEKVASHRDPARTPDPIPGLPPRLAAVLERMLAKDPAARYQTATEVVQALEPFCGAAEPAAPRRRFRSGWRGAAGLLFGAVALAACGVIYKLQMDNEVLTFETDDPDIEVQLKRNGDLVRIMHTKTKQAWELDTKKMRLKPDGGELAVDLPGREPLVLRRNGDVVMMLRRLPGTDRASKPPPVIPPAIIIDLGKKAAELKVVRKNDWRGRHAFITAFSPDGKFYGATGELGHSPEGAGVRLWDTASGKEVFTVPGCGWLAFSPDSKQMITQTDNDSTPRVWDIRTKKQVGLFAGHSKSVIRWFVSDDGKRLVTSADDQTIRVWDTESSRQLHLIRSKPEIRPFITPVDGGKSFLASDYNQTDPVIRQCDTESGKVLRSWTSSGQKFILNARGSADGKRFITIHPTLVRVWNVDCDKPVREVAIREGVAANAISPDLDWLLFTTSVEPTTVRLVRLSSGEVRGTFKLPNGSVGTHDFSPDGKHAVICTSGPPSEVYLFEVPAYGTGTPIDPKQ